MSANQHRHDHPHAAGHGESHEHGGHARGEAAPHPRFSSRPHPEHVVLELGEELGALIVQTDPELLGLEVEISPAADDTARSHKEVLERVSAGRSAFVLVFDGLVEGLYTLWLEGRPRSREVCVRAGEVARLDWRSATQAVRGAVVTAV